MILRSAFALGKVAAATTALAVATLAGMAAPLAADLTVAIPDGNLVSVLTQALVAPFIAAAGLDVAVAETDGSLDGARAAHADLLLSDTPTIQAACKAGVLAKLDWGPLGGRERMLAGAAADCGEGAVLRSTVLAWNKEKFSGQPNWGEFWDVAKVPGKRGLRRGARTNLEIALLADGVPAGDVYATLRTDGGIDRAFRKLDQLKPYVVWWEDATQPPKLLESGEVLMTSAPADRVVAAERGEAGAPHPDFALQWAGSLTTIESWALLAGSPHAAAAMKFLAFAADPKNQRRLPSLGAYGGATNGANDGLPPNQLAASPSTPANLAAGLVVDEEFWRDNGAKLDKLFDAWLAK